MPHEPTHTPPSDDASWESLAENLFGIELKQPGLSEDLAAEDLSLDDELLGPAPTPAASPTIETADRSAGARDESQTAAPSASAQSSSRSPAAGSSKAESSDWDFGADLGLDDELGFDEPAVPAAEKPTPTAASARKAEAPRDADTSAEDVRVLARTSSARDSGKPSRTRAAEPEDDFAADLDFDAPDDIDDDDDEDDETLAGEAEETGESAEGEENDTYWDALKNWEWDDAEEPAGSADAPGRRPGGRGGRGPRGGGGGGGGGGRAQSYVPRAAIEPEQPAWAEGRDELIEDPDFGFGLLDSASADEPADEPRPKPARPAEAAGERQPERPPRRRERREDEERSDEEGGRRRRRRRRGRGGAEPAPASATGPAPARTPRPAPEPDDLEEFGMDDMDVDADTDDLATDEPDLADDEFGLGLDAQPAADRSARPDREPRRGRRRRSRRRDRSEAEPAAPSPAPAPPPPGRGRERREAAVPEPAWGEPDEPDDELELAEDSDAAPDSRWEDVPTWEQAIGMLVAGRSSGRESSGRESSGREPPRRESSGAGREDDGGERSSRPRGRGGRRPRRRR